MSDAVTHRPFSVAPPAATPTMEDDDWQRRLREVSRAWTEEIQTWEASPPEREEVPLFIPKAVASQGPPPARGLLVERDANGDVIVGDPVGVAYGVGPSVGEAVQQWEELARQHYGELAREPESLHPRMLRQLRYLRRRFG